MKSYSQISFRVLNRNNEPLHYATIIWNSSNGIVTNEYGEAILNFLDTISDTLIFSNIGFKDKKIAKSNLIINDINIIHLEDSITDLPLIIVKKRTEKVYGYLRKKKGDCTIWSKNQQLMENGLVITTNSNSGSILKSFSLYISKQSIGIVPFRLKIYTVKNRKPDKLVIYQNLIFDKYEIGKWNEFDVSDKDIYVPESSFCIGIELLPSLNKNDRIGIGADEWENESFLKTGYNQYISTYHSKHCNLMLRVKLLN